MTHLREQRPDSSSMAHVFVPSMLKADLEVEAWDRASHLTLAQKFKFSFLKKELSIPILFSLATTLGLIVIVTVLRTRFGYDELPSFGRIKGELSHPVALAILFGPYLSMLGYNAATRVRRCHFDALARQISIVSLLDNQVFTADSLRSLELRGGMRTMRTRGGANTYHWVELHLNHAKGSEKILEGPESEMPGRHYTECLALTIAAAELMDLPWSAKGIPGKPNQYSEQDPLG